MSIYREYPEEVIQRARDEHEKGTFRRKILERKALDFHHDELRLECGHQVMDHVANAAIAMIVWDGPEAMHECGECREAWMKEAAAKV